MLYAAGRGWRFWRLCAVLGLTALRAVQSTVIGNLRKTGDLPGIEKPRLMASVPSSYLSGSGTSRPAPGTPVSGCETARRL